MESRLQTLNEDLASPAAFRCERCGNCCRHAGEVRLADGEADRIARHLGMSSLEFTETYTRLREDRRGLSLTERTNGSCVFLEGTPAECRIQAVKPGQCRDFPTLWRYDDMASICSARRGAA